MGRGGDDKHLTPERPMPLRVASTEGLGITEVDKVASEVDNKAYER